MPLKEKVKTFSKGEIRSKVHIKDEVQSYDQVESAYHR